MATNQAELKTVAIMTSGGDAPGMNPFIRAAVRSALAKNLRVLGIENGFEGLIHGSFRPMQARDVGGILQRGGTILQTSRCPEFREPAGQSEAIRMINDAEIDALIIAGGEGSLAGAQALSERGIRVIGVPASIDNDVYGTDICIGVDTALNTIVDAIDKLRDTASSHNLAFLVETMGRESGYLAVQAGIVTGAELVLVPEVDTPVEEVARVIEKAYLRGKTHCIVVVAEGAKPAASELAQRINTMDTGFSTRVTILGHIQRGGKPSAYDRLLASRLGYQVIELLTSGQSGVMVGLTGHDIIPIPLEEVTTRKKELAIGSLEMARILAL